MTYTYTRCRQSGRLFNASDFPKKCNCCNLVFNDRDQYLRETNPPTSGQFGCAKNDKVLEFRNCSCGSTLVITFKDERDYTSAGNFKRKCIGIKIKNFMDNGDTYTRAKTKAISEFENFSSSD